MFSDYREIEESEEKTSEPFWERLIFYLHIFYREMEESEEKTVERSPELSVGNGGELDLLMERK